ncbi:MAG: DUF2235 domain-containing protein [Pseudonocardiaceae bacterium]
MRHLVVCCDGTWNTLEQEQGGVPTPTNVVRLYHALPENKNQLRYYHPGVGTDPGLVDRMCGGGLGTGLAGNIKSAYAWLARTYQPGDAICLFGFSRGAYTVRSLAGMLYACGLATIPPTTRPAQRWAEIDRLYDEVYRPARQRKPGRPAPYPRVPIRFLGVWDTVGALGIPDALGMLNLLDIIDDRHRFHDTRLNSMIQHARHAVALDEHRGPFTPTLWTVEQPAPGSDRSLRQVWFPGDHCDVGGGHLQTGLSDAALQWMINEASQCTDLSFHPEMLKQIQPDPTDVLHDNCTGAYLHLTPTPRAVPLIDKQRTTEVVHPSAYARQARPLITVGEYRPSHVLAVGESASYEVFARNIWNTSGLYLEKGHYSFETHGEWLDRGVAVGPDGTSDGRFQPSEVLHLMESIVTGWGQDFLRQQSGNAEATFFGAPRAKAPWMALIAVIAAAELDANGTQQPYRQLVIGRESQHQVDQPGYLHAYANDVWGIYANNFYANNRGSVTMTVTRLD